MDWRIVQVARDELVSGRYIWLQNLFEKTFIVQGLPSTMALFSRRQLANDPDPFFQVYFSPASVGPCAVIIDAYGGVPGDRPPRENTDLLIGHQQAWKLLD